MMTALAALALAGSAAVLPAGASAVADDLEDLSGSVAVIESGPRSGAGFVVDERLVLTAAHVAPGGDVRARFASGDRSGSVVSVDRERDVALVELDDDAGVPTLPIATEPARIGSEVFALGAPLGSPSVSRGIVSARLDGQGGVDRVQTDAAVNPGNSGGPLLDEDGAVVGLVIAKADGVEGVAYATAASELVDFVDGPRTLPEPVERSSSGPNWPAITLGVGAAAALGGWALSRRRSRQGAPLDVRLGPARTHHDPQGEPRGQ
jgi:S1-C subfamily serine protease